MKVPGSVEEGGPRGGASEGAAEVGQALIRRLPAKTPRTQVDRIDAPLDRTHRETQRSGGNSIAILINILSHVDA